MNRDGLSQHPADLESLGHTYRFEDDDALHARWASPIKSPRRLEPGRGSALSTFAFHSNRRSLATSGSNAATPIRLPEYVCREIFPLRRQFQKLEREDGPDRAHNELSRWCLSDPRFFNRWSAVDRALAVRSLSDPDGSAYRAARSLHAPQEDEPLQRSLNQEQTDHFHAALARLTELECRIMCLRHGIGGNPQTARAISQSEGMPCARIHGILRRARTKLRTIIECDYKDLVPERDMPHTSP
jgi:DNA-directed RNA polymerase sigma subunit (sigma70/sigma32)